MWNTIATFKDNLTQIASDVLDTGDEPNSGGSLDDFDELYDSQRAGSAYKESDLKAELEWYRAEVPRLQAAESEIQSTSSNYLALLKDRQDELTRLQEENGILKEKLLVVATENGLEAREGSGEVKQLQELLKRLESEHRNNDELHQKRVAELQSYHKRECEVLIARHKDELAKASVTNHSLAENIPQSQRNGPVRQSSQDTHVQKLRLEVLQLQQNNQELSSQLLKKDGVYATLRTAHDRTLSEARRLEEELAEDKEASLQKDLQLQRDHETAQASRRESEALRLDNLKTSEKLGELQKTFDEHNSSSARTMMEFQMTISDLQRSNIELKDERDGLIKALEDHVQKPLNEGPNQAAEMVSERDLHLLKEATAEVDRLSVLVKEAEEACTSQELEFEKKLDKVVSERDKAVRDLARLRQHLLDKERGDSEKMDQDSQQIADLEARADASLARALKAEQDCSAALADLQEARKQSTAELSRATEDMGMLRQKLASCISALESKDVELSNLQSALGQYYAESEAQDRFYLELSAAREECSKLFEQLQIANQKIEVKTAEQVVALEKLTLTEQRTLEEQKKTQKLEDEVLRLRRALEQSMTRLNSLSSDSDHHVDRRIVIKLLVTYFQRNHSREVLDLMVRMLGFSEEDKTRVGLAQQAAGRGVVRGVLGLPGRFVGGIIGSATTDSHYQPGPAENRSFADLWIDFLLKESEEREKREKAEAHVKAEKDMGNGDHVSRGSSSSNMQMLQESSGFVSSVSTSQSPSYSPSPRPSRSTSGFSSAFPSPKDLPYKVDMSSQLPRSATGKVLTSQSSEVVGTEFSSIPLNTTLASTSSLPSLNHLKLPPRF